MNEGTEERLLESRCHGAQEDSPKRRAGGRYRFWEMDQHFKCPAVGMCLTEREQKSLAKKVGISPKKKSAFEIHEALVSSSERENRLSRKIDHLLNRKYHEEIMASEGLPQDQFMNRWRWAFDAGEYAGLFWAAATKRDLSVENRRDIFGAVHMAMHESGVHAARRKAELFREREVRRQREAEAREAVRERRRLHKENMQLVQLLAAEQAELELLRNELWARSESVSAMQERKQRAALGAENERLKQDIQELTRRNREQEKQVVSLQQETDRLQKELDQQQAATKRLQVETRELIDDVFRPGRCNPDCPSYDLCRKRVLVVGGLTRMEAAYRDLVQGINGVFEYHDGYVKGSARMLENRLKRADVVLCPVNCNSHAACSMVKNLGKKHRKAVHMLASSSLSAVSQALIGGSDEYAVRN